MCWSDWTKIELKQLVWGRIDPQSTAKVKIYTHPHTEMATRNMPLDNMQHAQRRLYSVLWQSSWCHVTHTLTFQFVHFPCFLHQPHQHHPFPASQCPTITVPCKPMPNYHCSLEANAQPSLFPPHAVFVSQAKSFGLAPPPNMLSYSLPSVWRAR